MSWVWKSESPARSSRQRFRPWRARSRAGRLDGRRWRLEAEEGWRNPRSEFRLQAVPGKVNTRGHPLPDRANAELQTQSQRPRRQTIVWFGWASSPRFQAILRSGIERLFPAGFRRPMDSARFRPPPGKTRPVVQFRAQWFAPSRNGPSVTRNPPASRSTFPRTCRSRATGETRCPP